MLVEGAALGVEVVGASDLGVAAGVAAADPALLEDCNATDAVFLREVVRGCQSMSTPADDDDVVGSLRLDVAPRRSTTLFPRSRTSSRIFALTRFVGDGPIF